MKTYEEYVEIGRRRQKHGIELERWDSDNAWRQACVEASQESPWQSLYRELLLLRVREPGMVLRYYGISPKSERAIEHTRGMISLLSDREREVIIAGDFTKLVDILYEEDPKREYEVGLYEEQSKLTPVFVEENHKRFLEKGMRAFR